MPKTGWTVLSVCMAMIVVLFAVMFREGDSATVPSYSSIGNEWTPAMEQTGVSNGNSFRYIGERPVRIMTTDLYENQGQKTIWLLDGAFGSEVEIIAKNQNGKVIQVGRWAVSGPLFDAAGHFPSSLVLPAGIWKLEAHSNGALLGSITVNVHAGVAPYNQWVEGKILDYIQKDQQFAWIGTPRFASLQLVGVESPSAELKIAYVWMVVESYDSQGKEITARSGWSVPAKFVINYTGSDYEVAGMMVPPDGNAYENGMKELFPPAVLDRMRDVAGKTQDLQEQNRTKAIDYFAHHH